MSRSRIVAALGIAAGLAFGAPASSAQPAAQRAAGALLLEACQKERAAVLSQARPKYSTDSLAKYAVYIAGMDGAGERSIMQLGLDIAKNYPSRDAFQAFDVCLTRERFVQMDRADAPANNAAPPVLGSATPVSTASSIAPAVAAKSSAPAGSQSTGWTCNPWGACAKLVSSLNGYDRIKQLCPVVIPMNGGVRGAPGTLALNAIDMWIGPVRYDDLRGRAAAMAGSTGLPPAVRNDFARIVALHECWKANEFEPRESSYGIIDSNHVQSDDNTRAIFARAISENREVLGIVNHTAATIANLAYALMPASAYARFMAARTEDETQMAAFFSTEMSVRYGANQRVCAAPGSRESPPFGAVTMEHLPKASLQASLDSFRIRGTAIVRTDGTVRSRAGEALDWLECEERNGWPNTAETTYFVMYKKRTAR